MTHKHDDDKTFSRIMKNSMLKMPFADFDDKVMAAIHKELSYKKTVSRDTRLSGLFFILGTGFGITIDILFSHVHFIFMGISSGRLLLAFQLGFVIIFLVQLEKVIQLFRSHTR